MKTIGIFIILVIVVMVVFIVYFTVKKKTKNRLIKIVLLILFLTYFLLVERNILIYLSINSFKPVAGPIFKSYFVEKNNYPVTIDDFINYNSYQFNKSVFKGYEPTMGYKIDNIDSTFCLYAYGFDFKDDEARVFYEPKIFTVFNIFMNGDIIIYKDKLPKILDVN